MAQRLHQPGTVHPGGFNQALRDVVDRRNVDDHQITRILPDKHKDDGPERRPFRTEPGQIKERPAGGCAD
ncbi:hypothetical protein D3C76_1514240 [compost metagenome]